MRNQPEANHGTGLPPCATEFIRQVVRRMWYRRKARQDVQAELTSHFEDAVRDCTTAEEKERRTRELIEGFGDVKLLAALCHRAKKRCRPWWQKVVLRSAQGLGVFVLYYLLCVAPILLGRPTIRVNYAEWLSNHWRPEAQEVENAKVYYDEAAKLLVPPPAGLEGKVWTRGWKVGEDDGNDLLAMEAWLATNEAAFGALRRGANTLHYWPTYDTNDSVPIEKSITEDEADSLRPWRHAIFTFRPQILWEARRGQVAQALDDCLALQRVGRHLQGKGSLNSQLVGISIEAFAYDGVTTILRHWEVPLSVLAHVQKELTSSFDFNRQVIDLACEKALWCDRIQRTFTDDGQGGGHALSRGFIYAAGDWRDNLINTFKFHYPDRGEAMAMVDQYFQHAQRRLDAPPPPMAKACAEPNDLAPISTLNVMLSLLTPAYDRVAQLAWRLKTHEIGLITLLAIQRYSHEYGSYPDNLDQLVKGGLLKQLPKDPFGPGSLTYRKTDPGFLLYSWGTNLKDDGGQLGTGSQGQPGMWAGNGDWVFWPVPEL